MGTRGPIGSQHGRRAENRKRKLRLINSKPVKPITKPGQPRLRLPKALSGNEDAAVFWREHAGILQQLGRLLPEYRLQFRRLCLLFARIQDFSRQIEREGATITGPRGGTSRHPLLTPLRQAEQTFGELAGAFGLDPKSAQRLPERIVDSRTRRELLLEAETFGDWEALR